MKAIIFLLFVSYTSYGQVAIVLEKPDLGIILYRDAYTSDISYFQNIYQFQLKGWKINEEESNNATKYIQGYYAYYFLTKGTNLFTILGMYDIFSFKNSLIYVKTYTVAQKPMD